MKRKRVRDMTTEERVKLLFTGKKEEIHVCTDTPKDLSYGIKPPISLVPARFTIEVAKCMKTGADKRSPYNWRQSKISVMQTLDKVLRHILRVQEGGDIDDESGLYNLAHAAADIAVLLDAQLTGSVVDDRPGDKS